MQFSQRFVADQRFDLPQYDSMLALISNEFAAYNKTFLAPLNRIVQGFNVINNGGLVIAIAQDTNSTLFNSQRVDHEQYILWKSTYAQLILTLADNATNFVEVQIVSTTCAPDTVAIWDSTANGGNGQEFTQNVNTQNEELPTLVSNTISFTGDTDKIRLATVVTSGGSIVSITDARQFLFHVDADWNFGVTPTDKTIANQKNAFDALATAIKQVKGTNSWVDNVWSSSSVLKEYQNLYYYGGGSIAWSGANLSWSADIKIEIANRSSVYTIDTGSVALSEGQAVYVVIPPGTPSGSLTPIVAAMSAVPINPASGGWAPGIQVLFLRRNNTIYGEMDLPNLSSGEAAQIGQDLSAPIASRLGVIDDATYNPYTSTVNILPNDPYQAAISKLDAAINSLQSSAPTEESLTSTGQTIFNLSTLIFDASNAAYDIVVFRNGVKQAQDTTGGLLKDYRKNSNAQLEFSYTVPTAAIITVRLENAGGGGGSGDLTNINVNPQPYLNGAQSVGTVTKAWSGIFLKDIASSQVYRLDITSGTVNITPVP